MAKERETFQQRNEPILGSLHHLCLSEKCQRKIESRAYINDPTQEAKPDG